jgi:hypothetical protein
MTSLAQELEEMRVRMNELAKNEQGLIAALGDALSRADHKLLDDVRNLSAEHEARRGAILRELQSLAARLGALPKPGDLFSPLSGGYGREIPAHDPFASHMHQAPRGDWRRQSVSIQDELNKHLSQRASGL